MPQHWEISEWEATFPGLSHFHYRNIPITILVSIIYIYFWRRFISSPDDRRSRREPCRAPSKNWNITGICGIGIYRLGYCRISSTFCRKFFFIFFFFFLSFETRFSPSSSGVFCAKRSDSASFLEYQRDRTNNKTSKSNWMEFRGEKNQQEELVINSAT